MGCVARRFFFLLRPDENNTKVALIIHPLLALFWEDRIGRETWSGAGRNQSRTPYTAARSHGSRKCPTPLQFPRLSLSLFSIPPSLSLLELSPFSSLPSSLSSLPTLTPDPALPLGFHPFPPRPACCGSCAAVPSWTACTFFPLLSSRRPLLCTRASVKWISPLFAWLSAVCVSSRVCGWERAAVSYPAKYA